MKNSFPPFVHSFPAPAVLLGCGTVDAPNLITISWFGTVCSEPPMISAAVRPSRYSHGLITKTSEFSVNIPARDDLAAVKLCGIASGRSTNKFAQLGLTAVPCPPLESAPMIAEFALSLGCRVRQRLSLGTHDLFLAEVVSVHGEPLPDVANRPQIHAEDQIVYLDGKYWGLQFLSNRAP